MKERIKSIDSLRGIAILAVVLIHTTTRTLEASGFNIASFSWALFLNQISRFAVPLFFMLSGLVLELSYKEENYWSFVKRRFSKIFIPYIFWSLFYYLIVYNRNHDSLVKVFLTGNASYQLYFIPTLCIFYLLFPLLRKAYKIISNKYVLVLITISQLVFLYRDYYIKGYDFDDPVRIALMSYFFFIVGIVAARNMDKINLLVGKTWRILPVVAGLSGLYVFWEGRDRYLSTGNYLSYYSQWRPSTLVYTILIGLTLYYFFEHTKLRNSVIAKFSGHSFFVFFIHVAVLETVWSLMGKDIFNLLSINFFGKIIFDLVFFGVVTLLSFLSARYIHKVSNTSKLLG